MIPQIPLPTDNLHKFVCLLGLALALSGLLGFYAVYTTTLDKKLALIEEVTQLELNIARSVAEDKQLELKKRVLEVTKDNEKTFSVAVTVIMGLGLALIFTGGLDWHLNVQALDNKIKKLELRRLELEVAQLEKALSRVADKVSTSADLPGTRTASGGACNGSAAEE